MKQKGIIMKLRKLCDKDAESMLEWMHDPAVNQFFRAHFAQMTMENARSFIRGGRALQPAIIMPSAMTKMRIRERSA